MSERSERPESNPGRVPARNERGGGPAVWCGEVELCEPHPVPETGGRAVARVLVRLHGVPLGFVELPLTAGTLDQELLLKTIDQNLSAAIADHLAADGLGPADVMSGPLPAAPASCPSGFVLDEPVSVVVCTRNRAEELRSCLRGLAALRYPRLEILIVDNAPTDDSTRSVFEAETAADPRFRYVREPRPGLSCARNRGLREATGAVVAYTDDDVTVDPDWVRALVAPFADPAVACSTGLVCTAAIDGPAERYFDARVSWAESLSPVEHRLGGETDHGIFPYATGSYGTGASFAVRTSVFRALGGFDEALGAGTRTGGGEDIDAFVRVILAGYTLSYRPAAVVWHRHRGDLAGLRKQIYAYGTGTSAFIAKQLGRRSTRAEVLKRVPHGVSKVLGTARSTSAGLDDAGLDDVGLDDVGLDDEAPAPGSTDDVPVRALLVRELAGLAAGPVLYARARWEIPPGRDE